MFDFGIAAEIITPPYGVPLAGYFNPRPNTGVLDQLQLKVALFKQNGTIAGIASFELCKLKRKETDMLIDALKKNDIDYAENIIICQTHTHTGPFTGELFVDATDPEYFETLKTKFVLAVKRAYADLAPAEMLATQTECSALAFNRRYVMKSGEVLTNPGKLNPDIVRPEGGIDPLIPVIAIKRNGKYAALIVNISNHNDTIGGNFVSADWPGRMEKELQRTLDVYDMPVMTIIAPQGNINHFDVSTEADQTNYAESVRIGKAYAAAVAACLYKLKPVEVDSIKVATCEMEAPYLTVSDEEYSEALATAEKFKDAKMEAGHDFTSEDIAKQQPFVMKFFAERLIACRENPIKEKRIERFIAISFGKEIGFVSIPCEPFVEIGKAIRENSKFSMTFLVALGMGGIGYVAMPEHYRYIHAYETAPSPDKPGREVGVNLIKTCSKLLDKVL